MSKEPTTAPGDSRPPTPQPPARAELELRKLELEIQELSRPWWRKLSYLAPLASITVAVAGLAWAVSSGYFDVVRRKNEIDKQLLQTETRELESRRLDQRRALDELEKRSKQLEVTNAQLAHDADTLRQTVDEQKVALRDLERRERRARSDFENANYPVITYAFFMEAPWMSPPVGNIVVGLIGRSFGSRPGDVYASAVLSCLHYGGEYNGENNKLGGKLQGTVQEWAEDRSTYASASAEIASLNEWREAVQTYAAPFNSPDCSPKLVVYVRRATDDREGSYELALPIAANEWFRSPVGGPTP